VRTDSPHRPQSGRTPQQLGGLRPRACTFFPTFATLPTPRPRAICVGQGRAVSWWRPQNASLSGQVRQLVLPSPLSGRSTTGACATPNPLVSSQSGWSSRRCSTVWISCGGEIYMEPLEVAITIIFDALLLVFMVKLFFALFQMKLVVILFYLVILLFAMAFAGRTSSSF
jgi:hypothetical protein